MIIKNPSNDKFDVIIVAGQSNALGCGLGETNTPFVPNKRIMMLNEDFTAEFIDDELKLVNTGKCHIDIADERVENGNKLAAYCLSFAKKYLENDLADDRKILIVQTAIGATGFAKKYWGENEKLTVRMFKMADAALSMNNDNRLVAVLWHQGEHDIFRNEKLNYRQRYDYYYGKISTFIKNLRERYGKIPFISGSFCPSWTEQIEESKVNAVLDAYKDAYSIIEKTAHVSNVSDLKCNFEATKQGGDYIHFCRDSSYELGRRYYKAYQNIVKNDKL